ncbi:MAG: hypothetical protein ACRDU5_19245 [Mycobacterium sp.]
MPDLKGDVSGLNELASFLQDRGNILASHGTNVAAGRSFQASALAVSAVHGSVTAAQGRLAQRMASTSERVRAAARNYSETEDSSAAGGPVLPSVSQIQSWHTTHLVAAAEHWTTAAASWENTFTAAYKAVQLPGGRPWEGDAAQAVLNRAHSDRAKVLGAVDSLNSPAAIARSGAEEIAAARARVFSAVAAARGAGFEVDNDLIVTDTRAVMARPPHA